MYSCLDPQKRVAVQDSSGESVVSGAMFILLPAWARSTVLQTQRQTSWILNVYSNRVRIALLSHLSNPSVMSSCFFTNWKFSPNLKDPPIQCLRWSQCGCHGDLRDPEHRRSQEPAKTRWSVVNVGLRQHYKTFKHDNNHNHNHKHNCNHNDYYYPSSHDYGSAKWPINCKRHILVLLWHPFSTESWLWD